MRDAVVVDAPAKINLFLRVLHRRDDGFHELETLFQTVSLADEVQLTLGGADPGRERLDVVGPDLGPVESNLAIRAARGFRELVGLEDGIHIRLVKRIPAGAGLGGGSSDAAAVLRGLAALTSFDDARGLSALAADLGSDVPFFLEGQPSSFGAGRGEVLTRMPTLPAAPLVLSLPPVHVSTPEAYRALAASRAGAPPGQARPSATGAEGAWRSTSAFSWSELGGLAENDFESIVGGMHPPVRASLEGLRSEGAVFAQLSGSGAASFGVFESAVDAGRAATVLEARLGWPHVQVVTRTEVPVCRSGRVGG